ncbi:MAG: PD40 domain-containing protein, partial [Bacteroidia bacterium]|nr:PD40 domain-containing protein [Bacteroidia bacterium]
MKKIVILLLLAFFVIELNAQTTNTSKWRKTERDSFENAFLLYEEGNHELAFPIYEACNKNHPNQPFIRYMYGKTALVRSDKHAEALEYLQEAYDGNKKIILIEYDLAKALHLNYKFEDALVKIDAFFKQKKITPEERTQAELLKKHILNAKELYAKPVDTKVINLGKPINTAEEEYSPVITIDESMFVYTYKGAKSKGGRMNAFGEKSDVGYYAEDVYYSVKLRDTIRDPKPSENINTDANDAAISLSPDGHTLFVYRDGGDDKGDIYKSDLVGEEFSIPVKLTGQVNSYSWDGHCSITPDGKTLYFSSERPGGFGGRDIYKATLQADSTWGNVVNLGDSINTKYDEDSPFIHPDGVTLFYSHNGVKSMGGYDVFRSRMEPDSTFKTTTNLGYPINTPDNDIYFVLAANGKRGYYSSGKPGGQGLKDIYLLEGYFGAPKAITFLVKGKVTSKGNPYES